MLFFILIILIIICFVLIIWLLWSIYSIYLLFFGAPFVRSKTEDIEKMMALVHLKKTDKIVDVGCGDGTIVIHVGQQGYKIEGFDINRVLVWRAQRNIEKLKLKTNTKVFTSDVWKTDLSPYSVIFLYGITYMMPGLEKKIQAELKPGSRVVSNFFTFPNWKPIKNEGKINVYEI